MAVLRFPFLSPDLSMRDPHRLASSRALSTHAKPRFCEQDRLLCEYGCWAFAVFTGEGDSHPRDGLFQRAFVEAGGLDSIESAMEAHRDSASLRRFVAAAFVARTYDQHQTKKVLCSPSWIEGACFRASRPTEPCLRRGGTMRWAVAVLLQWHSANPTTPVSLVSAEQQRQPKGSFVTIPESDSKPDSRLLKQPPNTQAKLRSIMTRPTVPQVQRRRPRGDRPRKRLRRRPRPLSRAPPYSRRRRHPALAERPRAELLGLLGADVRRGSPAEACWTGRPGRRHRVRSRGWRGWQRRWQRPEPRQRAERKSGERQPGGDAVAGRQR